jgi:hypothetical protein
LKTRALLPIRVGLFKVDPAFLAYLSHYKDSGIVIDITFRPIVVDKNFAKDCKEQYDRACKAYLEKYTALVEEKNIMMDGLYEKLL